MDRHDKVLLSLGHRMRTNPFVHADNDGLCPNPFKHHHQKPKASAVNQVADADLARIQVSRSACP